MNPSQAISEVREALKGSHGWKPTPGPWTERLLVVSAGPTVIGRFMGTLGKYEPEQANALFVTACNPSNITAILEDYDRLTKRVAELEASMNKIDAIRNDIIGRQSIGWSSVVYPLVAALGEAGYEGQSYEDAQRAAISRSTQ